MTGVEAVWGEGLVAGNASHGSGTSPEGPWHPTSATMTNAAQLVATMTKFGYLEWSTTQLISEMSVVTPYPLLLFCISGIRFA